MAKQSFPAKENLKALADADLIIRRHTIFGGLLDLCELRPDYERKLGKDAYARIIVGQRPVWTRGTKATELSYYVATNCWRRASPEEWSSVIAQALLHVAMNHVDPARKDDAWRAACELVAADMLRALGFGQRPEGLEYFDLPLPGRSVHDIANAIRSGGADAMALYAGHGFAGPHSPSWIFEDGSLPPLTEARKKKHTDAFANAIRSGVRAAVDAAGTTVRGQGTAKRNPNSLAERARSWFVANYPLLAALAATFEIVEDEQQCRNYDIAIAAVDSEQRRVYINPKFPWTYAGLQFTIAHELLHVGLRHEQRRQGRDPFLWNIACDYVINGWLVEMGIGELPSTNLMIDIGAALERESAEAVYDRIVRDLRLMRRLAKAHTFRGIGKCDVLGDRPPLWWTGPGCDLDGFYRRALAEGLDLHLSKGRGTLPGDMIEEIRSIQQPPIPWDVKLGQWLDAFFPPLESRRSFARASRRQSSTPDIPRPVWEKPVERRHARTFGVVLDTSGSMSPGELGRALGAIASYAMSREVPFVRVIQCDAGIHDMNYVVPETLLNRVDVRGRGGTVLQPAIVKLERADDFPRDAPILVITDGFCDLLTINRNHAFLMPEGGRLPFRTQAPQFHFEKAV